MSKPRLLLNSSRHKLSKRNKSLNLTPSHWNFQASLKVKQKPLKVLVTGPVLVNSRMKMGLLNLDVENRSAMWMSNAPIAQTLSKQQIGENLSLDMLSTQTNRLEVPLHREPNQPSLRRVFRRTWALSQERIRMNSLPSLTARKELSICSTWSLTSYTQQPNKVMKTSLWN